jgi:natural product precursor
MKKVKLTGKLSLNKETIANLTNKEMNNVKGGSLPNDCNTYIPNCKPTTVRPNCATSCPADCYTAEC